MPTLAVIGGGVIGLSVARRAAVDGWAVRVHRTDERGASWVAGGMLAPHSEGWPGEDRLLRIGLASLALWHDGFLTACPPTSSPRANPWWSPWTAPMPPT
jgi:glycine oxidase